MSLMAQLLLQLKVEIDQFVENHTRDDKYFQKQKQFITECRAVMERPISHLEKREQLLALFNQGFLILSAAGVWKLCGRLYKIVMSYSKDSLYMDEIKQLSTKVTEMAAQIVQMNQALATEKIHTVMQLTQKIKEQQTLLCTQQEHLDARDALIESLRQDIASLTIKNEKLFQQCQRGLGHQIPAQREQVEISSKAPMLFA